MIKYNELPMSLEKTSRLMTFLHHVLKLIPIVPNNTKIIFPLGVLMENITPSISSKSSWITTLQFLLSCLRSCPQQYLFNAGCTTPIFLGIVKQVILGMIQLPTNMDDMEEKCYLVGKELLDLLLIRDKDMLTESSNTSFVGVGTLSYYDVIYAVKLKD